MDFNIQDEFDSASENESLLRTEDDDTKYAPDIPRNKTDTFAKKHITLSEEIEKEYRRADLLNYIIDDYYHGDSTNTHRSLQFHADIKPSSIEHLMTWEQIVEAEGNTNSFWTSFNLMNDVLSSAVVAMPYYVKSIGVYLLVPSLLFFGIITHITLDALYHLARKYRITTYPELCQYALGTPGYITICFLMFIYNFGNFLGGLMIVGSNLPRILQWILGFDSYWISRTWVLIYSAVIFLPLSFFKKISDYKFNSFLSVAGLMALAVLLVFRAVYDKDSHPAPEGAFELSNITVSGDTLASFGGISFLFICHDLSFGVFLALEKSNRRRWSNVVAVMLFLTNAFFILTGLGGWFIFYDKCEANILDNFGVHDTLANIGRLLLTLNILISVPYNMFMPRFSIYALLSRAIHVKHKNLFHVLTTFFVMGASLAIAEVVTDLGAMFEIVGGISAVSVAYIMPSVLFLKLEKGAWWNGGRLKHIIIAILGTAMMIGSTFSSLYGKFGVE